MTSEFTSRQTILLVDDDLQFLSLLQRIIQSLTSSYELIAVTTAREALEQVERQRVSLLITDYTLGLDMNGTQLIAAVKARSPSTCTILVSGYLTPDLSGEVPAHSADYTLGKPFMLQEMQMIVEAALVTRM